MTTATLPAVPDTAELTAAGSLQQLLPHLVGLALDAKQAHWNVTGPGFLPLHELTDELAARSQAWADRVAERAVALGTFVDGRPTTVASINTEPLPSGRLADHEAIAELARRIRDVADAVRDSIDIVENTDVVAHDIAIEALEGLEKFRWMLEATNR